MVVQDTAHGPVPIELLPALCALLQHESVTAAARAVGVGQPAMSRVLERLRAHLGDPLLVRRGRGLVRSQRADLLVAPAAAALEAARRVLSAPERFDPPSARGVVTIATGDDLQAALAARLLVRLRAEAPGLDVRIVSLGLGSLLDAQRGVIDLAVGPDLRAVGGMPDVRDAVLRPIYQRRFVTVTARRRRLDLDAFCAAEHVLVSPQGQPGSYVDEALGKLGRARRVAVTVPTFQAALALIAATDLVATLPEDVVRQFVRAPGAPALASQRCPVETPTFPVCLMWSRHRTEDARHRWLRAHVREVLRGLGGR